MISYQPLIFIATTMNGVDLIMCMYVIIRSETYLAICHLCKHLRSMESTSVYGTAQFKLQARKWTARVHFVVRYVCFSKSSVSVGQCTEIFRPILICTRAISVHVYS